MTSTSDTRVDFYLLAGNNLNSVRQFCCRLTEKAWKLGHRVWIRTNDTNETRQLDDLLWTYSDGSFLPHARADDDEATYAPVIIGDQTPDNNFDLLINLARDVPDHAGHFQRIAEILNDDEQLKQQGRLRYLYYDKNNYTLHHHTINR